MDQNASLMWLKRSAAIINITLKLYILYRYIFLRLMCIKYNIIKNIIRNLIIMFFDLKISCHFKKKKFIYIYIYSKRYCLNFFSIKNFN